jgi:ketosteroid isomerase-like protein
MSQENVELVHEANDTFTRRDLDALLALADPDIEVFPLIARLEGGGPYRGHDGVRRWWENWLRIAPDFSAEQTVRQFAEWRQKKCVRFLHFASEAEALEAAELAE